jgi:hypothetical protein
MILNACVGLNIQVKFGVSEDLDVAFVKSLEFEEMFRDELQDNFNLRDLLVHQKWLWQPSSDALDTQNLSHDGVALRVGVHCISK